MAPTPLPGGKINRFSPRGTRVTLWIPAIAGFDAATPALVKAEIDGSTDLSCQIQAQSGFSESTNFTETPDQCSQVAGKIADGVSLEDGTITFYGASDGEDAGDFFARGMKGFIGQAWYGLTAGKIIDVYPVEVGSVSHLPEITGAQLITAQYALKAEKARITIPALT